MKRLIGLTSLCCTLPGMLFSAPFAGNDSVSIAMGGTGAASAETYAAGYFNPSLIAADAGKKGLGVNLFATKVSFDDSLKLAQTAMDFYNDTFDLINDYDISVINNLLLADPEFIASQSMPYDVNTMDGSFQQVADSIANVIALSGDYSATVAANPTGDFSDKKSALDAAVVALQADNDKLQSNMNLINSEIVNVRNVIEVSEDGLLGLSDKPLQAALGMTLVSGALPSEEWAIGASINRDLFAGSQILIDSSDTDKVKLMLDDVAGVTGFATDAANDIGDIVVKTSELSVLLTAPPAVPEAIKNDDGNIYSQAEIGNLTVDEALAVTSALQAYEEDIQNYANELDSNALEINEVKTSLENNTDKITNYEGNYISGGEFDVSDIDIPELKTDISIVGANITELGVSVARRFNFNGQEVNIGITPKLVRLDIFDMVLGLKELDCLSTDSDGAAAVDELDENNVGNTEAIKTDCTQIDQLAANPTQYLRDQGVSKTTANIDIGASKDFVYKGNLRTGLVIKNLIPQTFKSKNGSEIRIPFQLRAAVAHQTQFSTLALDLDITENKPLSFGEPTRYLSLGGELNAWDHAKFRLGYRNNLSVSDSSTMSLGLGLTPFGYGLDFAFWGKPPSGSIEDVWPELIQDIGFSGQFSMQL